MQDTAAAIAEEAPAQQSQAGAGELAVQLARAALGPVGTEHYLKAFDRLDAAGRPVLSWNWAAALGGPAWLAFRGLWRCLLIYGLVLVAVVAALAFASSQALLPSAVAGGLTLAMLFAGAVGLGLRADTLVHSQVQRRIQSAVAAAPTIQQAIEMLGKAAPGKARLWLVTLVALACVAALVLAALAWRGDALDGNAPLRSSESVSGPVGSLVDAAPHAQEPPPKPEPAPVVAELPEQDEAQAQAVQDDTEAVLAALAKPDGAATAAESATAAAKAAAAAASKDAAARSPARAAVAEKPKTAAAGKEPARSATVTAASGRKLYINVGIFADPANARRANEQLRKAGLPSAVDTLERPDNKRLQRVRVGPFTSAAQANEAAAKVRSLGLDAVPAVQ